MKSRMLFPVVASLIAIFTTGLPTVGFSQGKSPNPALTISNASINYGAGILTMTGTNLGQDPTVTFGTTLLSNVSSNGTTLTAPVPSAILQSPGVYSLTITRGPSSTEVATLYLTVGTQGPVGPPGVQGERGPQGLTGPAGAQGPMGEGLLKVYDSKNTFIGNVIGANAAHSVLVPYHLNGVSSILQISKTFIIGGDYLYFVSNDCTGTPYLSESYDIFTASATRGSSLYLPDPNSSALTITVGSVYNTFGFTAYCSGGLSGTDVFRPALEFAHFTDQFTPPFGVR